MSCSLIETRIYFTEQLLLSSGQAKVKPYTVKSLKATTWGSPPRDHISNPLLSFVLNRPYNVCSRFTKAFLSNIFKEYYNKTSLFTYPCLQTSVIAFTEIWWHDISRYSDSVSQEMLRFGVHTNECIAQAIWLFGNENITVMAIVCIPLKTVRPAEVARLFLGSLSLLSNQQL